MAVSKEMLTVEELKKIDEFFTDHSTWLKGQSYSKVAGITRMCVGHAADRLLRGTNNPFGRLELTLIRSGVTQSLTTTWNDAPDTTFETIKAGLKTAIEFIAAQEKP